MEPGQELELNVTALAAGGLGVARSPEGKVVLIWGALPQEKVRIRSAWVGGGFGGKEDMSVQHQAALCAFLVQRPVKVKFGRTDSFR